MKRRIQWKWGLGLALAILPFAGGQLHEALGQTTNAALALNQQAAPSTATPLPGPAGSSLADPTAEDDVVDAPAQPITTAKPLPPNVKPSAPAAEVIKLADSGVDEGVMLAFVTNSTSFFNLGAEEIIYLNDIGVPSAVVTAMIQRDQAIRALSANAAPGPAAPAPVMPVPYSSEPAAAPLPEEMAPQPDYSTGSYPPAIDSTYAPFYDSLAPYGTWIDVGGYGPCWQPATVIVNPGWQPYCDGGRWVYTDYGWYWMSGYSWGWAPFHYGRWFRHSHYGWCWAPGSTWGPSWVSWRYNGNYCGWAPLPPAAVYQPAIGLTFHGQHVNGSFGFGLGVSSYTFVPVSHFADPHPHRYALPHQHAKQIYHQTVPSVTIVGNSARVANRGIPVSRVETASHTQIHRVGIREVSNPTTQGARGERLEANSRTLSVFRPQFTQSTAAQPSSAGRPQPGIPQNSGRAVMPTTSTSPKTTPAPAMRPLGGSRPTQPSPGGGSGRTPDRAASQASATPLTPTGPSATLAQQTSDPAPTPSSPLILHGSDRSRESTIGSSASAPNQTTSPNSLIVRGNSRGSRMQIRDQAAAPEAESQFFQLTSPRQNPIAHSAAASNPRPVVPTAPAVPASPPTRFSSPRTLDLPVRTEKPSPLHRAGLSPAGRYAKKRTRPGLHATPRTTRSTDPAPAVSLHVLCAISPLYIWTLLLLDRWQSSLTSRPSCPRPQPGTPSLQAM